MAIMIMNDYYVMRRVSLGGEGRVASCSGICARVGGAAACSVRERASACSVRERELLPAAVQPVLAPVAVPEYLGARVVAARGDPLALCPCIGE